MPPLHLAVREGHLEIVRFLAERGAVNPKYMTYPYNETLLTVATDRGYDEIARLLEEHSVDRRSGSAGRGERPDRVRARTSSGGGFSSS